MNQNRRRNASLGCMTLIAGFFAAVSIFGLAYQFKPSYKIEVGSRLDEPYVSGFRTKEPSDEKRGPDWDGFDYRWTNSESKIDLPGLGSQPLTVTLRITPAQNPNPFLKVTVNEKYEVPQKYLVMPAREEFFEVKFPVPANAFPDGNLHLKLQNDIWQPNEVIAGSKDGRKLGLLLDWVKVEPSQTDFLPLVRPPDDIFIPLVISSMLVLLTFLAFGLPPLYALLLAGGAIGGVAGWLVLARLDLTELISRDFVRSLFFIWVVGYVVTEFGPKLFKLFGTPISRREAGWLAAIFAFQFVMLWGFMAHPMFSSSDLGLNIRLLKTAQTGNLYFPQELPNGQLAPYPPAYYLILLPFTNFTDNSSAGLGTLIKVASSLLQASEVFFIFYLSSLLRRNNGIKGWGTSASVGQKVALEEHSEIQNSPTGQPYGPKFKIQNSSPIHHREWEMGVNWAGLTAAAFYTICKYPYYIFSQGNHSNIFGVWTLLLFVCVTAGTLTYMRGLRSLHVPLLSVNKPQSQPQSQMVAVGSGRAGYNPPILEADDSNGLVSKPPRADDYEETEESGPSLSQRYFTRLLEIWRKQIWPVMAVTLRYLLPLALLVLVFNSHYGVFLFTNVFMFCFVLALGLLGGKGGRRDAVYLLCCTVGALLISYLLYYRQVTDLMKSPGDKPANTLSLGLVGDITIWFWTNLVYEFGWMVVVAAISGLLLRLVRPNWKHGWREISPVEAALVALTIAALAFAVLKYVIGLDSRFQLYLLPLVALAAGSFFGRVWRTGWAGTIVVSAIFLFQFIEMLVFWLSRITYYF